MKKRSDLTSEDFASHPVWVSASTRDDSVEPHVKSGPVPLMALVAVRFTAADGTEYGGFALHTKVSLVAPVVLTDQTQVPLYLPDGRPSAVDLQAAYERLKSTPERFFPVSVAAVVKTRNKLEDIWESFVYRDEGGMHAVV